MYMLYILSYSKTDYRRAYVIIRQYLSIVTEWSTDSFPMAIVLFFWLNSRKCGTVWHHLTCSRFYLTCVSSFVSLQFKIDWHASGIRRPGHVCRG